MPDIEPFTVHVPDRDLADLHARPNARALPLLLTHGWPCSTLEFEKVIRPHSDPVAHGGSASDAFHVVVPSSPGFGFSERPSDRGWHPGRTARAWAGADDRARVSVFRGPRRGLGCRRQYGTGVSRSRTGRGLHLTMPSAPPLPEDLAEPSTSERRMLDRRDLHLSDGYGFGMLMGTRPQTLGCSIRRPGSARSTPTIGRVTEAG
ncbi:epoxide hydrolase N-terminal domain-containing protein [Amycolatopsis sp. NPDC057786]|uniref:epoxide hydrolase N-terminal domain-containing protein n=1 Tax=Amycolatopsis sp. NPDC057786 TaxID=3346250 RepID=UPI00366C82AA